MTTKWLIAILSAAAMTASSGALAQAAMQGFYAGAEIGNSDFGSDDDTGFKVLGGYQFHRNVAGEVAYGFLYDKGSVEVTALEVVAVGMLPLANQISLLGKIGLASWEADGPGASQDGTDITWGLGVQYDLNRNLGLRAQWQRYETDPDSVDFLNVGVIWRF